MSHPLTWRREALVAPVVNTSGGEDPGINATANHTTGSGSLMSEALFCSSFVTFNIKNDALVLDGDLLAFV